MEEADKGWLMVRRGVSGEWVYVSSGTSDLGSLGQSAIKQ